jgi:serine-type D-Ala-D-Ala carboxypeptidase/endopeptidase (penicillin-binding protein 4)
MADPRFGGSTVSASVWVEGWGEVVAHEPDLALIPASNAKLFTAMGALALLDQQARLDTRALVTGPVVGGIVEGDLVVVGGGDPTLRRSGPHSLDALAWWIRAAGVESVTGALIIDESRWDDQRAAAGWYHSYRPAHAGALSALLVDENRSRADEEYLENPTVANGAAMWMALGGAGVHVDGGVHEGHEAPGAVEIARVESPTIAELTHLMLLHSDNMIAEALVKEIGAQAGEGSTAAGLGAIDAALERACLRSDGMAADGSGLSRLSTRSAREWRSMLQAARSQPWGPALEAWLPVAGHSGTLRSRLTGEATVGNVRAKTGTTAPSRALSGYLSTVDGRAAVFSVVVNGSSPGAALPAVDDLVATVASARG